MLRQNCKAPSVSNWIHCSSQITAKYPRKIYPEVGRTIQNNEEKSYKNYKNHLARDENKSLITYADRLKLFSTSNAKARKEPVGRTTPQPNKSTEMHRNDEKEQKLKQEKRKLFDSKLMWTHHDIIKSLRYIKLPAKFKDFIRSKST